MSQTTRLEPLTPERARQVFDLMRQSQHKVDTALALDAEGRVIGVVPADDPEPEHLLGDLDVHAWVMSFKGPGKNPRPWSFQWWGLQRERDFENPKEDDMMLKTIANVIADLDKVLGELAAMCAGGVPAVPYLIALGFDEIPDLIEALPPDTSNLEFYRNWARSSRELWEGGEGQAASYQLTQMQRKLHGLKDRPPVTPDTGSQVPWSFLFVESLASLRGIGRDTSAYMQ
jgi:hypothetical protein